MKPILILAFSTHFFLLTSLQAQNHMTYQWGRAYKQSYGTHVFSIRATPSGGVILAGNIPGDTSQIGLLIGNYAFSNHSQDIPAYDVFIASVDSMGNVQWAIKGGGSGEDRIYDVAIDPSGYIYIAGEFRSDTFRLGNHELINYTTSHQNIDAFLAKLDSLGNVSWLKSFGGFGTDQATCVDVNSSGVLAVGGTFANLPFYFDGDSLLPSSTNFCESFVLRLDTSGQSIWARAITGSKDEGLGYICVDDAGTIFGAGNYMSHNTQVSGMTFETPPDMCTFLFALDSAGNGLWTNEILSGTGTWVGGIATDHKGNAFVLGTWGGYYGDKILWLDEIALTPKGQSYDAYLAKINPWGEFSWARGIGGNKSEYGEDIAADRNGNVFACGHYYSPNLLLGVTILNNSGIGSNLYMAKFNPEGQVLWAKDGGGLGKEEIIRMALSEDCIYFSGRSTSHPIKLGLLFVNAHWSSNSLFLTRLHSFELPISELPEPYEELGSTFTAFDGPVKKEIMLSGQQSARSDWYRMGRKLYKKWR